MNVLLLLCLYSKSFLFQMALDQSENRSILDDTLSTTMSQSIQQKHAHGAIVRIRVENFMYKFLNLY